MIGPLTLIETCLECYAYSTDITGGDWELLGELSSHEKEVLEPIRLCLRPHEMLDEAIEERPEEIANELRL